MNVKFIDLIQEEDLVKTMSPVPWGQVNLWEIPYPCLSYPNGYMFTMGSGCASMATISQYGVEYISGIHVVRQDWEQNEPHFNLDHYVCSPTNKGFAVFQQPAGDVHYLTPNHPTINKFPTPWRHVANNILGPPKLSIEPKS